MTVSEQTVIVSEMDNEHLARLRANVDAFMRHAATTYTKAGRPGRLLDIAPQHHAGARPFFDAAITVETLDIDPAAGATYVGDLCQTNACLAAGAFDFVVCTEVLEHTLQPFDAIAEIRRVLKPGGLLLVSVPFNLRIHGPLPDCWRFTEHGLRALLRGWELLELTSIETPGRALMPIHYPLVARKPR
jgi:SAM-dependent methyltransferase